MTGVNIKLFLCFHSNLRNWQLTITVKTNYVAIVIIAYRNVYIQTHLNCFIIFVLNTKYLNGQIHILIYLPVICVGGNFNTCIKNSFHNCYLDLCIGTFSLTMADFVVFDFWCLFYFCVFNFGTFMTGAK